MQKILELTEKEFLTGIAPSGQVQDKGLFVTASGVSVFGSIFGVATTVGLLQGAPTPTDISGSVIVDKPFAWANDVSGTSTKNMYIWGDAGHLYKIDISGDNNPTDVSTGAAVSDPANGLFVFKHNDGTKFVYYFQKTQLGRWDPTAAWATRTSNYYTTNISNTDWHPTHRFLDRVYFGNLNYIGQAEDDGTGDLTIDSRALDLSSDERCNTLSDDGVYLVAGLSTNTSGDPSARGVSRVIFWDTNQSSWQREWPIPDAAILAIRNVGGVQLVTTSRGLFACTFDSPPQPVLPYQTTDKVPNMSIPSHFAVDVVGEALLYGGSTIISTYGKLRPDVLTAHFEPFNGITGHVTMVAANIRTGQVIVGTSSNKLYRISFSATPGTGAEAQTIFIDLKRWWQVGRITLEFEDQLASGDVLTMSVTPDSGTSSSIWGVASFASHGAVRTKELYKSLEARKLSLIPTFTGGAVRIRRIEVWGDPISTPTHTRT